MAQPLFEPALGTSYTPSQLVVILCSVLSIYNGFELLVLIFTTFRHYKGLYFWSLLISSFGLLPYNVGFLIEFFTLTKDYAGVIIDVPGWVMMVTGQSVVLYSRLHLVLPNRKILRAVLWMIIIDALTFHTSTTIVRITSYYGPDQGPSRKAWDVIEKFQMTGFCVQEFIVSGLYLYETIRLLQVMKKNNTRRTIWELTAINVVIIAMDIGLLVVEYLNLTVYEQCFKGVIYSIKLKLEFAILGKLVKIVRSGSHVLAHEGDTQGLDFVDVARNPSNATQPDDPIEADFRQYSVAELPPGHQRWSACKEDDFSTKHLENASAQFTL